MTENIRSGRPLLVAFFLVLACVWTASAQEKPSGTLVYAEGREFSIVRAGAVTRFVPADGSYAGFQVQEGDLLRTESSTFVEVQLLPKGTMLKIAENTSFVFQKIGDAKSETSLNLLYGRVRTKVAKLAGAESFMLRSRNTVAGVRGTDFGFDSIMKPGSAAQPGTAAVLVYAFSGEVSVAPAVSDSTAAAAAPAVLVKAGELVAVDLSASVPLVERRAVDEEIRTYWRSNDFKGIPPVAAPEGASLAAAAEKPVVPSSGEVRKTAAETQLRYEVPDYEPYRRTISKKNNAILGAFVVGLGAVLVQSVGASVIAFGGDEKVGTPIIMSGTILTGASLLALSRAFFIKTPE